MTEHKALPWVLFLILALTPPGFAQTTADISLTPLADGVYVALQPEARQFNDSNSLVLIGPREVLVVDAQARPAASRGLIAAIKKITDRPVRYLVHTHWHGDHTQSNRVWLHHFTDLEIVGHTTLREDIPERATPGVRDEIIRRERAIGDAQKKVLRGEDHDGQRLNAGRRAEIFKAIEQARADIEDLEDITQLGIAQPTLTFEDRLILERGGRRVELTHFRAHTRGDVVLYLPQEKILVSGDLLDALPFGGHGYPSSWIAALDALAELDFEILVPGHGPVYKGEQARRQLTLVRDFLAAVLDQARAAHAEGKSLDETRAALDVGRFRALFTGDGAAESEAVGKVFDSFLPDLVERAVLEVRGELDAEP